MKFTRPSNFLLIIFMFNINISFAEMPNYTCFVFSEQTDKSRYKIMRAIPKKFITERKIKGKFIHLPGWLMPHETFHIIDMKNGNESMFGTNMSSTYIRSVVINHVSWPVSYDAGYISYAKPVTKKGIDVQGCTNNMDTDHVLVKNGKCCVLKIIH